MNWDNTQIKVAGIDLPEDQKHKKPYSNVMELSLYEKQMLRQEKAERLQAKLNYEKGIQGIDGGTHCKTPQ